MKHFSKTTAFWIAFGLSILLFVITCWSAIYTDTTPYWVESLGFFILSYICFQEFAKRIADISPWFIGAAIILGQILLHIAIRISDFYASFGSLMIVASTIVAVLLAIFCYKKQRPYAFVVSYIVISLFNSVGADLWRKFIESLAG
ncbi:MAG: hypothetical protein J1F05_05530 [Muribaculaceae bacterium]|nr:hypothetical protein [Muribaculaceae bacterium]